MTLDEALQGKEVLSEIRKSLVLIEVPYWSFDGKAETGTLVVHRDCTDDLRSICSELAIQRFPIEKMVPVCQYGWDDDASMRDNNTSAFNYRFIAGTDRLSNHAFGRAIDINPRLNPYIRGDTIAPEGATYDPAVPGTVTDAIARLFTTRGWEWGGDWTDRKDWQHFEKT